MIAWNSSGKWSRMQFTSLSNIFVTLCMLFISAPFASTKLDKGLMRVIVQTWAFPSYRMDLIGFNDSFYVPLVPHGSCLHIPILSCRLYVTWEKKYEGGGGVEETFSFFHPCHPQHFSARHAVSIFFKDPIHVKKQMNPGALRLGSAPTQNNTFKRLWFTLTFSCFIQQLLMCMAEPSTCACT